MELEGDGCQLGPLVSLGVCGVPVGYKGLFSPCQAIVRSYRLLVLGTTVQITDLEQISALDTEIPVSDADEV